MRDLAKKNYENYGNMGVLEDETPSEKLENEPNLQPKIDQKAKLVLEEIIESERKYVKTLNAIVEVRVINNKITLS